MGGICCKQQDLNIDIGSSNSRPKMHNTLDNFQDASPYDYYNLNSSLTTD